MKRAIRDNLTHESMIIHGEFHLTNKNQIINR